MVDHSKILNRHSIRIKEYDYTKPGAYFITICTYNRVPIFGNITHPVMVLSEFGKLVQQEWTRTVEIRNRIELDDFMVMPNHFLGIIMAKGTMHCAPTVEQFGKPISNSIPTIIRGFKSAVTVRINAIRCSPGLPVWQRNYYEHIIRDDNDLNTIRQYIRANPENWEKDEEYII